MPKILGISASLRKEATEYCVKQALKVAQTIPGVVTSFYSFRGKDIKYCVHCDRCIKGQECKITDDVPQIIDEIIKADGVIFGSPVYTMTAIPQLLVVFNRMRSLRHILPNGFWGKVGGAIAVGGTRNGGQETTINTIINCMLSRGMFVVGGSTGNYSGGKVWTDNKGLEGAKADGIGNYSINDIGFRVAAVAKALEYSNINLYNRKIEEWLNEVTCFEGM